MTTEELRAIAERATPGPWEAQEDPGSACFDLYLTGEYAGTFDEADAFFIATARNYWDAMVDVIEATEALCADPFGSLSQRTFYEARETLARLREMER